MTSLTVEIIGVLLVYTVYSWMVDKPPQLMAPPTPNISYAVPIYSPFVVAVAYYVTDIPDVSTDDGIDFWKRHHQRLVEIRRAVSPVTIADTIHIDRLMTMVKHACVFKPQQQQRHCQEPPRLVTLRATRWNDPMPRVAVTHSFLVGLYVWKRSAVGSGTPHARL